jgi:hypothetical protein
MADGVQNSTSSLRLTNKAAYFGDLALHCHGHQPVAASALAFLSIFFILVASQARVCIENPKEWPIQDRRQKQWFAGFACSREYLQSLPQSPRYLCCCDWQHNFCLSGDAGYAMDFLSCATRRIEQKKFCFWYPSINI